MAGEGTGDGEGDATAQSPEFEPQFPAVPTAALEASGWTLRDTQVEVRARVAGFTVRAHERRYEDDRLRASVRAAGGPDHLWRLFFATRLTFAPSLPPVVGPAMAMPKVRPAAREEFVEQLHDEGLIDVEQAGEERLDVASGTRGTLAGYNATLPVQTDNDVHEVPMEGLLAIWHDGAMLLGGGLYPTALPPAVTDSNIEYDAPESRSELQALIAQIQP